jgi:hypothetical protein
VDRSALEALGEQRDDERRAEVAAEDEDLGIR